MAEYFSVDRTENDLAILISESQERFEIPFSEFETKPGEGMVFRKVDNRYIRDEKEEQIRKKRIYDLQKQLFKK